MKRKLGLILGTLGMVAFIGACSDDTGTKPAIYLDSGADTGGVVTDTGGVVADTGGVVADTGGPATDTCMDIVSCVDACGTDQTCATACVSKGTADAQAKFQAVLTCFDGAIKGTCATQCANQSDPACGTCVKTECAAENTACQGGGGTPEAGFGDFCDGKTPTCKTGFECVLMATDKGLCTKTCTNKGGMCTGSPTGTQAFCFITDSTQTKFWCGFVCKISGQTYNCPSTLTCGAETDGQASCEP
ncbi:MAG: hypothetical protein KAI47_23645 [Deltaproteobacteria bacterium]|nr:hypothetical protein [Deltaproteobacteria bacterium]